MSNPSKKKGTKWETAVSAYLQSMTGVSWPRQALHGRDDQGDLKGVFYGGRSVVVECKDCRRYELAEWIREAVRERDNAGADICAVAFHRNGRGFDTPEKMGGQLVLMTMEDFARLLVNQHPLRRPYERKGKK